MFPTSNRSSRRRPTMQCLLCHRHSRIPANVADEIDAGDVALLSYLCPRCSRTPKGREILATWPTSEEVTR